MDGKKELNLKECEILKTETLVSKVLKRIAAQDPYYDNINRITPIVPEGKKVGVFSETMYRTVAKGIVKDFEGLGIFTGTKLIAQNVGGVGAELNEVVITLRKPFLMKNSDFRRWAYRGAELKKALEEYDGILVLYRSGEIGEAIAFSPKAIKHASKVAEDDSDHDLHLVWNASWSSYVENVKYKGNVLAN